MLKKWQKQEENDKKKSENLKSGEELKINYMIKSLCESAGKGDLEKVKKYIEEMGIDINVRTECGYTPLFWAIQQKRKEVIKYLLEKGVKINKIIKLREYGLNATGRDIALDTNDNKFIKWFSDFSKEKYQEAKTFHEILDDEKKYFNPNLSLIDESKLYPIPISLIEKMNLLENIMEIKKENTFKGNILHYFIMYYPEEIFYIKEILDKMNFFEKNFINNISKGETPLDSAIRNYLFEKKNKNKKIKDIYVNLINLLKENNCYTLEEMSTTKKLTVKDNFLIINNYIDHNCLENINKNIVFEYENFCKLSLNYNVIDKNEFSEWKSILDIDLNYLGELLNQFSFKNFNTINKNSIVNYYKKYNSAQLNCFVENTFKNILNKTDERYIKLSILKLVIEEINKFTKCHIGLILSNSLKYLENLKYDEEEMNSIPIIDILKIIIFFLIYDAYEKVQKKNYINVFKDNKLDEKMLKLIKNEREKDINVSIIIESFKTTNFFQDNIVSIIEFIKKNKGNNILMFKLIETNKYYGDLNSIILNKLISKKTNPLYEYVYHFGLVNFNDDIIINKSTLDLAEYYMNYNNDVISNIDYVLMNKTNYLYKFTDNNLTDNKFNKLIYRSYLLYYLQTEYNNHLTFFTTNKNNKNNKTNEDYNYTSLIPEKIQKLKINNLFDKIEEGKKGNEFYHLINFSKLDNDIKKRIKSEYLNSGIIDESYLLDNKCENIFIEIQKAIFTLDFNKFGQLLMLHDSKSKNKINFYGKCKNILDTINNCIKNGFIKDKLKIIIDKHFIKKKSNYYLIDLIIILLSNNHIFDGELLDVIDKMFFKLIQYYNITKLYKKKKSNLILKILVKLINDKYIIEFIKKEDDECNNIIHLITEKDDYKFLENIQKFIGDILINENCDYISYFFRKKNKNEITSIQNVIKNNYNTRENGEIYKSIINLQCSEYCIGCEKSKIKNELIKKYLEFKENKKKNEKKEIISYLNQKKNDLNKEVKKELNNNLNQNKNLKIPNENFGGGNFKVKFTKRNKNNTKNTSVMNNKSEKRNDKKIKINTLKSSKSSKSPTKNYNILKLKKSPKKKREIIESGYVEIPKQKIWTPEDNKKAKKQKEELDLLNNPKYKKFSYEVYQKIRNLQVYEKEASINNLLYIDLHEKSRNDMENKILDIAKGKRYLITGLIINVGMGSHKSRGEYGILKNHLFELNNNWNSNQKSNFKDKMKDIDKNIKFKVKHVAYLEKKLLKVDERYYFIKFD